MTIDKSQFYGTDADKMTALCEYGLLVAPYTEDGNTDEYFVVYSIGNGHYDTGYKREGELNDLINGNEWASKCDIDSFLSTHDCTLSEWMELGFSLKLYDCISYWGYENIMGSTYTEGITEAEAIELYI